MTNREKLRELFPYLNIIGTVFMDKHTEQVLATSVNFNWLDAEYKEPSTKNNLAQERYQDLIEYFGDEKVSKIILENRGQFKAWLERLRWHVKRADELARELEQIKGTTKNNLGVDCISRADVLNHLANIAKVKAKSDAQKSLMGRCLFMVESLPSVTPQEPRKGHWKAFIHSAYHGTDEDGEPIWREVTVYHCSQCNRRTVIKEKYCPNCGADMREMPERKALRPIEGNNDSYNCENYIP